MNSILILAQQLGDFCDFLRQRGRIPGNIPDKFHGHAYLLRGYSGRKLVDDGLLLVRGDAVAGIIILFTCNFFLMIYLLLAMRFFFNAILSIATYLFFLLFS